MPRGKRIRSGEKNLVMKLYNHLKREEVKSKTAGGTALQKTIKITGFSKNSVHKILTQGRELPEGAEYETPVLPRYSGDRQAVLNVDSFDRAAIRKKICFLQSKKKYITLANLFPELKANGIFKGSRSSLHRLLRIMNYRFRKVVNKRIYYKQPHIIKQREDYLIRMHHNRSGENRPVIYLDETWMNAHDGKDKQWVQPDTLTGGTSGGVTKPYGKGKRLIILHAGSENGWVPNAELVFQSGGTSDDYHKDMDHQEFERWFKDQLLPNIPVNSIIAMDNASYHSRRYEPLPTSSWRKGDMISWLANKNIPFPAGSNKKALYIIIKQHKSKYLQYAIDEMAKSAGHKVVRLPVGHCELNPIEMAWAQVKGYAKQHNTQFTLEALEPLVKEGIAQVTPERWHSLVQHVREKVEDRHYEADRLSYVVTVPDFSICVGDSSAESDSDDSDDELNDSESESDISDEEDEELWGNSPLASVEGL